MQVKLLLVFVARISSILCLGRDKGVPLSSVKTLTLRAGQSTTGRRSTVSQLKCVGGSAQGLYEVDVLQCRNLGGQYSSDDIQWACTAARLPDSFQLGSTEVICEGFSSPSDPNITPGSCGVEYTLHLTEIGEQRYSGFARVHKLRHGSTLYSRLFGLVFIGMLVLMAYNLYKSCTRGPPRVNRGPGRRWPWNGFFGGGGDGGGHDNGNNGPPPPPYSRGKDHETQQAAPAAAGMSPWAAAGLGAAGYMLGRMTSGNGNQREERRANTWGRSPYGPSQSQFGSYNSHDEGSSGAGPSSSNMDSMRSSTGFGGTRRR